MYTFYFKNLYSSLHFRKPSFRNKFRARNVGDLNIQYLQNKLLELLE